VQCAIFTGGLFCCWRASSASSSSWRGHRRWDQCMEAKGGAKWRLDRKLWARAGKLRSTARETGRLARHPSISTGYKAPNAVVCCGWCLGMVGGLGQLGNPAHSEPTLFCCVGQLRVVVGQNIRWAMQTPKGRIEKYVKINHGESLLSRTMTLFLR